jgi:hypothetical protein
MIAPPLHSDVAQATNQTQRGAIVLQRDLVGCTVKALNLTGGVGSPANGTCH